MSIISKIYLGQKIVCYIVYFILMCITPLKVVLMQILTTLCILTFNDK